VTGADRSAAARNPADHLAKLIDVARDNGALPMEVSWPWDSRGGQPHSSLAYPTMMPPVTASNTTAKSWLGPQDGTALPEYGP
jgi:hypothetical protein